MSDSAPTDYVPLWLTAEEHRTLFGDLLLSTDPQSQGRVAELLRQAEARGKDTKVQLSLQGGDGQLDARISTRQVVSMDAVRSSIWASSARVFLIATLGIALLGVLLSIFFNRAVR